MSHKCYNTLGCFMHILCMMIGVCMLQSYLHSIDIQNLIKVETCSCFKWQYLLPLVSGLKITQLIFISISCKDSCFIILSCVCIMEFLWPFVLYLTLIWTINISLLWRTSYIPKYTFTFSINIYIWHFNYAISLRNTDNLRFFC